MMTEPTPQPPPDSAAEAKPRLPFSKAWPLIAGVLMGLLLRLGFSGKAGEPLSAMSPHFVYLAPIVVSMITVYVAETLERRSWTYYFVIGGVANALFVLGTMAILIEGLVCAVIIVPLFMLLGALAGLVMGAVCRWTNWPKRAVYGFAALPMLLALGLPAAEPQPPVIRMVERSVVIAATPQQIWQQLLNARDIRADEVGAAWMYRTGVPLPQSGVTHETPSALVREVTMGKAIHFEQIATDWRANEHVRWAYRFSADSFPPGALDDHVTIGGRYFDVIDTSYTLTPHGAAATELRIRFHYRVSTDFNWYAEPIARALIGNFEEVILGFYQRRATGAAPV